MASASDPPSSALAGGSGRLPGAGGRLAAEDCEDLFAGLGDLADDGDEAAAGWADGDDDDSGFGCALGLMDGVPSDGSQRRHAESVKQPFVLPLKGALGGPLQDHSHRLAAPQSMEHSDIQAAAGPVQTSGVAAQPQPGDEGLGDGDWLQDCELATSPCAPSFFLSSPHQSGPPRKGAVLLDACLVSASGGPPVGPATASLSDAEGAAAAARSSLSSGVVMEFEAVVVLLGGRWPARGLLSGRWPPLAGVPPYAAAAGGSSQDDGEDGDSLLGGCWGGSDGETALFASSSAPAADPPMPLGQPVGSCPNVRIGKGVGGRHRPRRGSSSGSHFGGSGSHAVVVHLSLIHISEPTRPY